MNPSFEDSDEEDDDGQEDFYELWVPDNGEIPGMENDGHQFEDADDEYVQEKRARKIGFLQHESEDELVEEEEEAPDVAEIEKRLVTLLQGGSTESSLDKYLYLVVTLTAGLGGACLLTLSALPMANAAGLLFVCFAVFNGLRG